MIKQPQAGVRIYNYQDRLGSDFLIGKQGDQKIENVIKVKDEIISISTLKHKAQPAGQFEITLAPNINWLSSISPGSWISIHMTSEKVSDDILFSFKEDSLKMIGRIDSVRMNMSVNQVTGARQTYYTISGRDWGQVFESILYVDPVLTDKIEKLQVSFLSEKYNDFINSAKSPEALLSTTKLIEILLQIWGESPIIKNDEKVNTSGQFINVQSPFEIPGLLSTDLKLKSSSLSKSIVLRTGKLQDYDKYIDVAESSGCGNPMALIGQNIIWQVLSAHSCGEINEMFCDLNWKSGEGTPNLTLFKRIKPFALNCVGYKDPNTRSDFVNVYRTSISKESIISMECGDNWRDKINAVEIMPGHPPVANSAPLENQKNMSKINAQQSDKIAIKREGLRPLLMQTFFYPQKGTSAPLNGVSNWIPTFVDWYFNSHKMFNGSFSFVGNSKYIPVGSNVLLDASVFTNAPYVKGQDIKNSKFLAHVESISNNFSILPNGSRSFITSINFVRGVFVDKNVKGLINKDSFAIDSSALSISSDDEKVNGIYKN